MQKKTKSKLTDFLFVFICLAGTAFATWQFTKIFYETFKGTGEPIAQIELKKKTANRRLNKKVAWDRLQNKSLLYNGDTIRTAPGAEATISLANKTSIELTSNSMAQIFLDEEDIKGSKMSLDFGDFNITNVGAGGLTLDIENSQIELTEGASISGTLDDNGELLMQIFDGQAVIKNENGSFTYIKGDTAKLSKNGFTSKNHIQIISPRFNNKYISFSKTRFLLPFEWSGDDKNVLIEVSNTKSFSQIVSSQEVKSTQRIEMSLPIGTYYWRITSLPDSDSANFTSESTVGKFSIVYSPTPKIIYPENEFVKNYRTKTPNIRFAWQEVELASSYQFEISNKKEMGKILKQRNLQGNSVIIDDLEAGTYYCRVLPYYVANNIGFGPSSEIVKFTINQSDKLENPILRLPENNSIVSTKIPVSSNSATYKKMYFSWDNSVEAEQYTIKLWPKDNPSKIIKNTTKQNYISFDPHNNNITNGNWEWQVILEDSEGNTSESDIREFYAIDTEVQQRTLFPPDSYHIVDSRTQDLRYSWKSNIPDNSTYEISTDPTFKKVIYTTTVPGTSVSGKSLSKGTYYWRIKSTVAGIEFTTQPKTLIVDPPLPAPETVAPVNGGNAVIKPSVPFTFIWNTVPLADYYKFKIAYASNPEQTVYEKNLIESKDGKTASVELLMDDYPETSYILTLQAFREETNLYSRASGFIGTYHFNIKQIKPYVLLSPNNNTTIDGATAIMKTQFVTFKPADEVAKSTLVIYKDKVDNKHIFYQIENPKSPCKLPVLYEGTYFWKISAFTKEGYDVSSLETRTIKITAIPKLPSPSMNEPKKNAVFDKEYFKSNKKIDFKWGHVSGADQYVFTLTDEKGNVLVNKIFPKTVTEYTFVDMKRLPKGRLTWSVEAQSLYEGIIFQHGKTSPSRLKIDLPDITAPTVHKTGTMYGK